MNSRFFISLGVFVTWIVIILGGAQLASGGAQRSLDDMVQSGVAPQFVIAVVFLFAVVWLMRWRDVGLNCMKYPRSLLIFMLPSLFLVLFFASALIGGLPPARIVLFVFVNTLLVGISEELACRGILYQGLRERLSIWPAILWSAALFGAIHALNGFMTGDFKGAALQAVAASFSGVLFIAMRLRTGSLIPGMIFHTLWDFGLFLASAATAAKAAPQTEIAGWYLLLPILLALPNLLYGLFLLRNISKDKAGAGQS